MAVIKTALISVSDKAGIVEFARGLAGFGILLISLNLLTCANNGRTICSGSKSTGTR